MQVSTCWLEGLPAAKSLKVLSDLALPFAQRGGLQGWVIGHLIWNQRWTELVNFEVKYTLESDTAETLYNTRQALALFQKLEFLELPGVDKEAVAYDKWAEAEMQCFETNNLFRKLANGSVSLLPSDTVVLHHAKRILASLLGRAPSLTALKHRFGPGSTSTVAKKLAAPPIKLGETPTCSRELFASGRVSEVFSLFPRWRDQHSVAWEADDVLVTEGNLQNPSTPSDYIVVELNLDVAKLSFVPKNAKTHRAIDVQPTLNTLIQGGIGDYMMARLGRRGINLRDQEINKRLAREGSIHGETATMDLSSASDTISTGLVKYLLPEDWFELLSLARCGTTVYDGEAILLNKFCSMGNGYTFPLESAIFYALAKASIGPIPGPLSVFGDDIILPSQAWDFVVRTFELCGFTVNKGKSYRTGPFRESCGGDYFKGIPIRPYYQKKLVSGQTLFTAHNFFARNGDEKTAAAIRHKIPSTIRLYGPDGYGDGHLISDTWTAKLPKEKTWGGVFFDTFALDDRFILSPYYGDVVAPSYSIYVKDRVTDPLMPAISYACEGLDTSWKTRCKWAVPNDDSLVYSKKRIYTFMRPYL